MAAAAAAATYAAVSILSLAVLFGIGDNKALA